jgi:DnaJ-class molecular chaperone
MKKPQPKPAEEKCPACNGTGFPEVKQPTQSGRKIYPPPCKECAGKGRIASTRPAVAGRPKGNEPIKLDR